MRTLTLTLTAVALATSLIVAQSGNLTVPFTSAQRDGMQFSLDIWNAANPEDQKTLGPYGIENCQSNFDSYVAQRAAAQERLAAVRNKYLVLSDADKATVEALINSLVP